MGVACVARDRKFFAVQSIASRNGVFAGSLSARLRNPPEPLIAQLP
jgi:hypothetical protein